MCLCQWVAPEEALDGPLPGPGRTSSAPARACRVSQHPLSSRNGLPVRADGHRVHQSPDGTLLIHNLRARDEGSYTCSAYRGSQAVSRSTEVKVLPPGKEGPPQAAACLRELAVCGRTWRARALQSEGLCQLLVV